jgi:hypothetical protein
MPQQMAQDQLADGYSFGILQDKKDFNHWELRSTEGRTAACLFTTLTTPKVSIP